MRISLQRDWQIDNGVIKRPITACTQILVHKLGTQNKDFGAVSQTDLTRSEFLSVVQARSIQIRGAKNEVSTKTGLNQLP